LVFGLDVRNRTNWEATIIWLTVDYAPRIGCAFSLTSDTRILIRWHDTATDESTKCTSGAFVIAPSAVTTLFRISISIYDHSIATLSVRTVSNWE
jgi:hypothetical protein